MSVLDFVVGVRIGLCGRDQYGTLWSMSVWDFVVGVRMGLCGGGQYGTLQSMSVCDLAHTVRLWRKEVLFFFVSCVSN